MEPRYKVGDEVTIKSWEEIKATLNIEDYYTKDITISFVKQMHRDLEKTYTISNIEKRPKSTRYYIHGWWYVEDWIKPKEVESDFPNKHLILFMCLQLLSGNRPDKSIFKNRIPFKDEGGFDWYEFKEKLSMECATSTLPNWPILTLDIDFAELILIRIYEYPMGLIDLEHFTEPVEYIIDCIEWPKTPEGFDFWCAKYDYYNSNTDSKTLKQLNTRKSHENKLQRKKSTVIRGTVPEGSITRGRKRKVTITVGYLSNSVCIGG